MDRRYRVSCVAQDQFLEGDLALSTCIKELVFVLSSQLLLLITNSG